MENMYQRYFKSARWIGSGGMDTTSPSPHGKRDSSAYLVVDPPLQIFFDPSLIRIFKADPH